MVILCLVGGLGNQMFQYATGRALAERLNTELKLDTRELDADPLREFGLDCFGIDKALARWYELEKFQILQRFPFKLFPEMFNEGIRNKLNLNLIKERSSKFEPKVSVVKGEVYLKGYWQDERYFKNIDQLIRTTYTFPDLKGKFLEYEQDILQTKRSVSIHIRRGDYVHNSKTKAYHGSLGIEYYTKAIEEVAKKVKRPEVFVFSDEIGWAQKNLRLPYPTTFIRGDADKPWVDMKLMSLCRNNVIANSSFSWWGAWLNKNPDKTVVAPKRWYIMADRTSDNLIPSEWMRI